MCEEAMEQQDKRLSGLSRSVFRLMLGLASVMVAISAVLSAAGFLVLRSNANLLGLSSFLHHSVGDYLHTGGRFFISTLWDLVASIAQRFYILIFAIAAIVIAYLLGKRIDVLQRMAGKIKPVIRYACILFAIFLLFALIRQLSPSDEARDLLFAASNHPEIAKRASEKSLEDLEADYVNALFYIIISIVILWGVNEINRGSAQESSSVLLYIHSRYITHQIETPRLRDLLLAVGMLLLYLLFIVELTLLPLNYGQSVYPNDFHRIEELILSEKLQSKIPRSENIWFLKGNSNSFAIYLGDTQEVMLIPKSHVLAISITGRENILGGKVP